MENIKYTELFYTLHKIIIKKRFEEIAYYSILVCNILNMKSLSTRFSKVFLS